SRAPCIRSLPSGTAPWTRLLTRHCGIGWSARKNPKTWRQSLRPRATKQSLGIRYGQRCERRGRTRVPSNDYQILFSRSARKDIVNLPTKISEQVERAIDRLLAAFRSGTRPQDMKPIQGRPRTYRVDSGEYRVLFEVDEETRTITMIRVRHRKDVYRNL